jgi:mycoredoxin
MDGSSRLFSVLPDTLQQLLFVCAPRVLKGKRMPHSPRSTRPKKITMYATTWCGDCRRAKRWLDAHAIPYESIDIETDEQAAAEVLRINGGMRSVPTIVFPDGSILVEPNARELSATCLQTPEATLGERLKNFYRGIVQKAR